jgi:acetolactate synthase-1/3 small subunit
MNLLDKTRDRVPSGRFSSSAAEHIEGKVMRHIISLLLENESGALSRVANLFSARGYNIEALSVAPTDDDSVSRMTLVTRGTDDVIEQISKQLNKLVDVIRLVDLTESNHIERELMLVKVKLPENSAAHLAQLAAVFRGTIIDVSGLTYTVEVTGSGQKLDAFLENMSAYEVIEVVRSGPLGIARGERILHV